MDSDSKHIITALQRLAMFWRANQWLVAKDFALNPTQCEVLTRVAAKPERAIVLADAFGISQASLSDSIAALDRKGLVRRRRDPDDGRARTIEATRAGTSSLRERRNRCSTHGLVTTRYYNVLPLAKSKSTAAKHLH